MGVSDDWDVVHGDALSVTDSGVFSDNDGCSSGRSSPVSCKEGTTTLGGGERDRFSILTFDQVKRVDSVLNEVVALEGRGNFPALEVTLKDLLTAVKDRLLKEGLKIRDIRLNGGAASYALMPDQVVDTSCCYLCGYNFQQQQSSSQGVVVGVADEYSASLMCSCPLKGCETTSSSLTTSTTTTTGSTGCVMNYAAAVGANNVSGSSASTTSNAKALLSVDNTLTSQVQGQSLLGSAQDGGAGVLTQVTQGPSYNDIDLIFGMELSTAKHFDRVKTAVLDALLDLLPAQVSRKRMSPCALKEAYVSKMVKVCEGDRWSLIALGNVGHTSDYSCSSSLSSSSGSSDSNGSSSSNDGSKSRSCSVELKFVDSMRRQYEFSVDSFQIVLDSLMLFYKCAMVPMSPGFYPTVLGESVYGDFNEALFHLHNGLIATRSPEEIRGGGLLKFCNLVVRGYRPHDIHSIQSLQKYMCSRFFIDFPDIDQQEIKLRTYLANHMSGPHSRLRYAFLVTLNNVVDTSTVCLMGHERRLTLHLIQRLSYLLYMQEYGAAFFGTNMYPCYQTTYYMSPSSQQQAQSGGYGTTTTASICPGTTTTLITPLTTIPVFATTTTEASSLNNSPIVSAKCI